jgi:hypothetical protein
MSASNIGGPSAPLAIPGGTAAFYVLRPESFDLPTSAPPQRRVGERGRALAGEAIPYVPHLRVPPAHIFIERQPRQDGMAGFAITMLPPPELRPRTAAPQPVLFWGSWR